jgi:hypothetical protein
MDVASSPYCVAFLPRHVERQNAKIIVKWCIDTVMRERNRVQGDVVWCSRYIAASL